MVQIRNSAFALLFFVLAVPAFADVYLFPSKEDNLPQTKVWNLSLRHWYSQGSGMFRKSFPFPFGTSPPIPPENIHMGSTLNYKRMDTQLDILSVEVRPVTWLSLDFGYGDNLYKKGIGEDHDWIHAPGYDLYSQSGVVYYNANHADISQSQSRLTGSTKLTEFNTNVRMLAVRETVDDGVSYVH